MNDNDLYELADKIQHHAWRKRANLPLLFSDVELLEEAEKVAREAAENYPPPECHHYY